MATAGPSIENILNENENEQLSILRYKWSNDIQESNVVISNIEYDNNYIEENKVEISTMIDRLNKAIDYYAELGIDIESVPLEYQFQEIRRNLDSNYRKLSLLYYKSNFETFDKEMQQALKEVKTVKVEQEEVTSNMKNLNNKIENLGATFLNIVLTISITSTMITLLSKVNEKYALSIVLSSAWLLLTCIIFVGSYFKNDNRERNKITFSIIIYIILTVITLITFLVVSFPDICNYIEKNQKSSSKEKTQKISKQVDLIAN